METPLPCGGNQAAPETTPDGSGASPVSEFLLPAGTVPVVMETARLVIRPFRGEDLVEAHRILNEAFGPSPMSLEERQRWLEWSILSQVWLRRMHQPPYGDRAVTLKPEGILIGMVGYVPLLDFYDQIPSLGYGNTDSGFMTPEVGLFWAVDPAHQRRGYASEAAAALITAAFEQLHLRRILATTEYTNTASQAVMRRLGMHLESNPRPDPPWLQVVGVMEAIEWETRRLQERGES